MSDKFQFISEGEQEEFWSKKYIVIFLWYIKSHCTRKMESSNTKCGTKRMDMHNLGIELLVDVHHNPQYTIPKGVTYGWSQDLKT